MSRKGDFSLEWENLFIGAHSNAIVGEFQNTVIRCRAFLIIVQMRNATNKGVKIAFATTRFSPKGGGLHKIGSGGVRPRATGRAMQDEAGWTRLASQQHERVTS